MTVTKIAHEMATFCIKRQVRGIGFLDLVVLSDNASFLDPVGFVILTFLVDPPAIRRILAIGVSYMIAIVGACHITGEKDKDEDGGGDQPAFGKNRFHVLWYCIASAYFRYVT